MKMSPAVKKYGNAFLDLYSTVEKRMFDLDEKYLNLDLPDKVILLITRFFVFFSLFLF